MKSLIIVLLIIPIFFTPTSAQVITIAEAMEDLNGDFIPDRLGDTVTVQGVVFTPRFHNVANQYFIDDGTAGINIYMPGPPTFNWNLGDKLQINGEVVQYFGLTEIIALDSSSWVLNSTGNPTPEPIVLSVAQYLTKTEAYEGLLMGFISLTMVDGTWPSPGNNTNIQVSDGIDTLKIRINRHTDIDDNPEPTWPRDIICVGNQYTTNIPPNDGYFLMPRFYSDFLPAGTIPVELTSFIANVNNEGNVVLNWSTDTEVNNQMFEIERRSNDGQYATIGYVEGYGTTTEPQAYSYIDNAVEIGTYFYRLKQIDFSGQYEYSDEIEIEVNGPLTFRLEQNYPNPFNPSTLITYSVPENGFVKLSVYNLVGEEVSVLVKEEVDAGFYEVEFNAVNLPSGIYFYRLQTPNFTQTKKMILLK
jgi:hypothetical protein